MSADTLRHWELRAGLNTTIAAFESDWKTMRQRGNAIANEHELGIRLFCYNEMLHRWVFMGTFHGHMRYTNLWGEKSEILPDYSGLKHIDSGKRYNKKGLQDYE